MNHLASLVVVLLAAVSISVPGFAEETIINFEPEEFVQADGNDIVVPGYSVPSFENWNNDLLKDLIVGEGGGTIPGKIRVYLNMGTESDPCFTSYFYVQADGEDLTCTPQGCMGCFPRVVYWDWGNRKDLLVGQSDGTVKIFLNIVADLNQPVFDAGTKIKVSSGDTSDLDVGSRATPILLDWDNDGKLDVVVGALDGLIHIYYNCGCGGSIPPHFNTSLVEGLFLQEDEHYLQVPSGRSSPVVMDLDGDGKKDLLTGNTNGQILFYKNVGTDAMPAFSGFSLVQSNGVAIDLPDSLRSRPSVCHWTDPNNRYWDLLVGYGDGKIRLYRNIGKTGVVKPGDIDGDGDLDGNDLTLLAKALDQIVPLQGSPVDLNNDGVVDIYDLLIFIDLWLAENGGN